MRTIVSPLTACIIMAATASAAAAADVYVAPGGVDSNPGTAEKPLATVARGRDVVRRQIAAGLDADVTVWIGGGTYFLSEPLAFAPADSPGQKHRVTYAARPGPMPVLSAGRVVAGWKKGKEKLWTVHLPRVAAGRWYFRQLFVDGRRAVRARTPNCGATEYCWRLTDAEIARDLKTHTLTLGPGRVKPWSNLPDVEAVVLKNWATLHKRIQRVEAATGLVVLQPPHVKYFGGNRPRKHCGCFFENAPEMLDEPGEWYLDRRTGVLTYWPRRGEDMTRARVVAPVLSHVVSIAGEANRPVVNLHFRGLAFMHNHLPLPAEGHHGRQAAFRYGGGGMPCAVRWRHARGCSLTGCRVAHVGGGGVDLQEGCRNNVLEGNEVFDAEGNGINVGGPDHAGLVPRDNRIANNYVHHCGVVYYGACGIWAGFAQRTAIEHNLVCRLPYTGISIGWRWDPKPTTAREYIVTANHVHDVMKEVCDGGAIYSLGYQPGTVIRGNLLHDVQRSRYAVAAPNNGMFLDEGSKGFLIEGNVIYNTSGEPVRHNRNSPKGHTWRGNHFSKSARSAPAGAAAGAGLEPKWRKTLTGK